MLQNIHGSAVAYFSMCIMKCSIYLDMFPSLCLCRYVLTLMNVQRKKMEAAMTRDSVRTLRYGITNSYVGPLCTV